MTHNKCGQETLLDLALTGGVMLIKTARDVERKGNGSIIQKLSGLSTRCRRVCPTGISSSVGLMELAFAGDI